MKSVRKEYIMYFQVQQRKLLYSHMLGTTGYRAYLQEKKGLGVLVENKLNMRWQCTIVVMKVHQFLDCISKNVGNRLRKELFLLYSISLKLHLEYRASFWSLYYKSCSNKLKQVQQRVIKVVRGMDDAMYKEMLEELRFFFRLQH